jgi:hypothetical protein
VYTTATHDVAVDGTSQREPCCSLDGPEFWRPNDTAHNTRRARIFWSTELHPIFAATLPLHTVQPAMPPCPGHHLDTDAGMEDHRSPVLLMGLGNGKSYGAVEQAPTFKNGHTEKAPPGKCLVQQSIWDDEETWAEHDVMHTPPSKTNTTVLAAASSAPSELSESPVHAKQKKTQRKLDAELKNTQGMLLLARCHPGTRVVHCCCSERTRSQKNKVTGPQGDHRSVTRQW